MLFAALPSFIPLLSPLIPPFYNAAAAAVISAACFSFFSTLATTASTASASFSTARDRRRHRG
jgi:hypothetical protein